MNSCNEEMNSTEGTTEFQAKKSPNYSGLLHLGADDLIAYLFRYLGLPLGVEDMPVVL